MLFSPKSRRASSESRKSYLRDNMNQGYTGAYAEPIHAYINALILRMYKYNLDSQYRASIR